LKAKEDTKDAMACGVTWLICSAIVLLLVWERESLKAGLIWAFVNPVSLIFSYATISFALRHKGEEVHVPTKQILREVKKWGISCLYPTAFVALMILWLSLIDKQFPDFRDLSPLWTAIIIFGIGSFIYFEKKKNE